MRKLGRLKIENFKSIRDQTLRFGQLNVFIGANGVGKSNLIGVFTLLNRIASQLYVGRAGGADSILHCGRKTSSHLSLQIEFQGQSLDANGYSLRLVPTGDDRFVFDTETVWYHDKSKYPKPYDISLGSGHTEAKVATSTEPIAAYVRHDLTRYRVYHFHDTSESAAVKQTGEFLRPDAGNLAAFLYRLKETDEAYFRNIEGAIRLMAPFFDGFNLSPSRLNNQKIRLEWKQVGNDSYFNANSLSDGTLRFMCLATLLLQPSPPEVVLLDEPELGLHPAAINLLADLINSAAARVQVVISTQSVTLVNQFGPQDIWVVDRKGQQSVFKHLADSDIETWLDDYAVGELWEKNVIGGRP
jgi:predicted ATPase